jgi:hypothetical protein
MTDKSSQYNGISKSRYIKARSDIADSPETHALPCVSLKKRL